MTHEENFLFAALYLGFYSPLFSDNKTLFHYPLNNGDLWEYEKHGFGALKFWVTREVIGDSTLPNGKTYKTIRQIHQRDGVYLLFQRIENNEVYQYASRFVSPDSTTHEEILLFKLAVDVGDIWPYPGYGYDGFLADSGFYRVNEIDLMNFGNRDWNRTVVGSYTLPDHGTWFDEDMVLLDSLGLYVDSFEGGYFELRGAIIDGRQYGTITFVNEGTTSSTTIPESITLFKAYPNPIISTANICFDLSRSVEIDIAIFDLLGRKIYEFPSKGYNTGSHLIQWKTIEQLTGRPIPTGVYFIKVTTNSNFSLTQKLVVLK